MKITHRTLGEAVLRDNKPLSDARLKNVLEGGLSLGSWYRTLNSIVFFWPTKERLVKFLCASSHRDRPHDVITIRTADLLARTNDGVGNSLEGR